VAVLACGICGSDLHTLRYAHRMLEVGAATGMSGAFDPDADFVMGHEYAAEVLELGPGTDGATVAPGDLVVSVPALIAGTELVPLGFSNVYPGAYAERMLLTAGACIPVPNGLDHRRAALTEPMAVGLHAVNKSGITERDAALVVGCGPIGLAIIVWLSERGIEPIVASDLSTRRRALAAELGAHVVVDPHDEPVFDAWRRVDGMRSVVAYEAVGLPGMLDEMIFDAPPQARVLVAGVCMEPDTIRPLIGVVKEINLQFAFGYDPVEFAETLHAIAEGTIDVAPLVTGSVGLDGVPGAFETLADPEGHVKILVEPGAPAALMPLGDTPPGR
jgi:threonine dehydrogenase-like Zn-dependent dehydrogenase